MSIIGQFRADHMDLVVKNWSLMMRFYSELFGVTAREIEVRHPGVATHVGLADPNALSRVAIFLLPGGFRFHFHHFPDICEETDLHYRERYMPGHSNLAFAVDDIDAVYSALQAKSVSLRGPPVTLDTPLVAGVRFLMFDDPEGNTIEVVQRPQGWDIERSA